MWTDGCRRRRDSADSERWNVTVVDMPDPRTALAVPFACLQTRTHAQDGVDADDGAASSASAGGMALPWPRYVTVENIGPPKAARSNCEGRQDTLLESSDPKTVDILGRPMKQMYHPDDLAAMDPLVLMRNLDHVRMTSRRLSYILQQQVHLYTPEANKLRTEIDQYVEAERQIEWEMARRGLRT